jgi:GNAT superfamily N-acetyltransferase
MVELAAPWLQRALAEGAYQGILAENENGRVVAGGGVFLHSWSPRPGDDNDRRPVIVNVFTEPEFRKKGLARQVMSLIIQSLREQGFRSVVLHASDEGRPLYESMGFVPTNEMRLCLE